MRKRSAEELVQEFADNVVAQEAAMRDGRFMIGNRHATEYERAWRELRAMGDEGREAFAGLLKHPDPDVRTDAACRLLRYRISEALQVLRASVKRGGINGLAAELNIQRWKDGTWELDPPGGVELPERPPPPPRPPRERTGRLVLPSPIPRTVRWEEIPEWERFDDRRVSVDVIYANTIGVNAGYIEWCPNDEPPSWDETLGWLWIIRPDLGPQIAREADEELRQAIEDYEETFEA